MSGVYIKDMKMPKSCDECFVMLDLCSAARKIAKSRGPRMWVPTTYRPDDCPLQEIKPHGGLIEKNAVFKLIQSMPSVDKLLPVEFMKALQEIPTVIPAEEGER